MKRRQKRAFREALQMVTWKPDRPTNLGTERLERAAQAGSPQQHLSNSNSIDIDLNRDQALKLLVDCGTLAGRLAEQGMDLEMSSTQDQITLKGFEAVWLCGWLDDPTLQSEAGLSPAQIATLGYLLAQQQSHSNTNINM